MNSIRKIVRKILKEAFSAEHSLDRLSERFIDRDNIQVGYEERGSTNVFEPDYKSVGTYSLSSDERESIKRKYKLIEGYEFPKNEDFAVILAYIWIDPKRINYYSEEDRLDVVGKNLFFLDRKTKSNGNKIYAIIRNNEIETIYFAKDDVPQTKEKLRVDRIIKNELFFTKLNNEKKRSEGGSRKKIELDLPKVKIGGKDWYIDEPNEELIYSKNIKKKISFDRLSEKQFEELIELI